jgi:hypothetical protein
MFHFICKFYYEHVSIWRQLTFKTHAETHTGLQLKCTSFLSNFTHNWNVSSNFTKIPQFQISWKFVRPFSNVTRGKAGMAYGIDRFLQLSTAKDLTLATCSLLWCSLGHTAFRTEKTRRTRYADSHQFISRSSPLHYTPDVRWISITNGEWVQW